MKKPVRKLLPFDDFLGLTQENFEDERLLVFHGISGSGKSANLNYLTHHHASFKGKKTNWIWTHHKRFPTPSVSNYSLVVVDEIISPIQLPAIRRLLQTNEKVAVASHLHPIWFKLICPFIPSCFYQTDSSSAKISTYLQREKISHSPLSVETFVKNYGSNYVDLQCILENARGENFDQALELSQRFIKISNFKPKDWIPSIPRLEYD
jgi:hypothetical protein